MSGIVAVSNQTYKVVMANDLQNLTKSRFANDFQTTLLVHQIFGSRLNIEEIMKTRMGVKLLPAYRSEQITSNPLIFTSKATILQVGLLQTTNLLHLIPSSILSMEYELIILIELKREET